MLFRTEVEDGSPMTGMGVVDKVKCQRTQVFWTLHTHRPPLPHRTTSKTRGDVVVPLSGLEDRLG